jgi:hypothetical protein
MPDCHVLIGTLLVHPCARPAKLACAKCDRPMCRAHDRSGTCVVCSGAHTPAKPEPDLTMADLVAVDPRDAAAFDDANPQPTSFDS